MGSPTGLADRQTEQLLGEAATKHGVYIPSGAFWGGEDIRSNYFYQGFGSTTFGYGSI